jgi:hypothetical protein
MPLLRPALRDLAEARYAEACHLLNGKLPGGAYYLAGLSVQVGLKACLAAQFRNDEVPDWAMSREFKSHDLAKLVGLANLTDALNAEAAKPEFKVNRDIVLRWNVDSRYRTDIQEDLARQMVDAVGGETNGVLTWIRARW